MLYYDRPYHYEYNDNNTHFIYTIWFIRLLLYFPPLLQFRLDHLWEQCFPQVHRILSMWCERIQLSFPIWSMVKKIKSEPPASLSKSYLRELDLFKYTV